METDRELPNTADDQRPGDAEETRTPSPPEADDYLAALVRGSATVPLPARRPGEKERDAVLHADVHNDDHGDGHVDTGPDPHDDGYIDRGKA